jgi:hypothetical protein
MARVAFFFGGMGRGTPTLLATLLGYAQRYWAKPAALDASVSALALPARIRLPCNAPSPAATHDAKHTLPGRLELPTLR